MSRQKQDEQICTHYGEDPRHFHGAVVPPIYENTLFVYESFEDFVAAIGNEQNNYVYSRGQNPTVEIAEQKLAELEGGERCKLFASGMAAISAAILNSVKSGDHVLCIGNIYGPTLKFLKYLEKFQVEYTVLYSTQLSDIQVTVRENTVVIYLESPTTMTIKLIDLPAVAQFAKLRGIRTIIDNTWSTPLFQKPLQMGIDIVCHSVSKYLAGHSDVLGGAVISSQEIMSLLFSQEYQLVGGVMAPYEAWLLLRGLRTLPIRMRAVQENAIKVAEYLNQHPAVAKVNYPGLPDSPDYELSKTMLTGYSGVMSFELKKASFQLVKKFINSLNLFQIGVSWGSFESLVLSPNYGYNENQLQEQWISPGLIRISVGLEHIEEIIADLDQAFQALDNS